MIFSAIVSGVWSFLEPLLMWIAAGAAAIAGVLTALGTFAGYRVRPVAGLAVTVVLCVLAGYLYGRHDITLALQLAAEQSRVAAAEQDRKIAEDARKDAEVMAAEQATKATTLQLRIKTYEDQLASRDAACAVDDDDVGVFNELLR